jgi:nicotinamide mononucleotide adenylyltransferase
MSTPQSRFPLFDLRIPLVWVLTMVAGVLSAVGGWGWTLNNTMHDAVGTMGGVRIQLDNMAANSADVKNHVMALTSKVDTLTDKIQTVQHSADVQGMQLDLLERGQRVRVADVAKINMLEKKTDELAAQQRTKVSEVSEVHTARLTAEQLAPSYDALYGRH